MDQLTIKLAERIDKLEKRIELLENISAPTIPIYDASNWPTDAVEGQVVIAPTTV